MTVVLLQQYQNLEISRFVDSNNLSFGKSSNSSVYVQFERNSWHKYFPKAIAETVLEAVGKIIAISGLILNLLSAYLLRGTYAIDLTLKLCH